MKDDEFVVATESNEVITCSVPDVGIFILYSFCIVSLHTEYC